MDDLELISRTLTAGDKAAFGCLVQRHQAAVRHFLRHLVGTDHSHADDLAQETFIEAWRQLDRFAGRSTFLTWLLGIAHNRWRNARRRQRPESLPPEQLHPGPAEDSSVPLSDLRQDLAAALSSLPEPERLALHLFFGHGLSHAEIAQVLGCPLGTVKTNLNRGKEKLRPLLASWNPNP